MFLGHFALGIAAKKISPKTPLPLLVAGAQLVDLLWPLFLLIGIETVAIAPGITDVTPLDFTSYPITHSLLTSVVWGLLFGGIVYAVRKEPGEFLLLASLVVSHWLLDFLTHRPDLPLTPGSDIKVGLGLWYSMAGTVFLESTLFAASMYIFRSVITGRGNSVPRTFWVLAAVLLLIYIGNLFGGPPPSSDMIAIAGNAMWLFVLWAWWVEQQLKKQNTREGRM